MTASDDTDKTMFHIRVEMLGGSWIVSKKYEDFVKFQGELESLFERFPVLKQKEASMFAFSESVETKTQNVHKFVVVAVA